MQRLSDRPQVLHEYLRVIATGVLKSGSPETRAVGRETALDDAVSRLWVISRSRPFQAALAGGLTVLQAHSYLSRSLARDLACPDSGATPSSILDFDFPSTRSEDDPAIAAAGRDLARLLSRRLPGKCHRLLLARVAGRDEGARDAWEAVERELGLSSGTRKRIWNRVKEILNSVNSRPGGSVRVWLLALRTMVEEERRDETRRDETRRDETRRSSLPAPSRLHVSVTPHGDDRAPGLLELPLPSRPSPRYNPPVAVTDRGGPMTEPNAAVRRGAASSGNRLAA